MNKLYLAQSRSHEFELGKGTSIKDVWYISDFWRYLPTYVLCTIYYLPMYYVQFYLTYLPTQKSDIFYGRSLRLPGREKLPKVKEEFIRNSRVTCHVNVHLRLTRFLQHTLHWHSILCMRKWRDFCFSWVFCTVSLNTIFSRKQKSRKSR